MSEGWNIAILGATGAVGEALLETLAERQFPVGEIYALARHESAGEHLRFGGKSVIVRMRRTLTGRRRSWRFRCRRRGIGCWIDDATNAGCSVIDSSGLFALEPDVPLVVPEVNPYVLADYRNRNVIAIADSLTSQLLAALKPLIDQGTVAHRRHQYVISVRTGKKRSMRWPDRVRSCLTAYRLMKMISLAASWRSICCRCCRIVKAACAENVVSSMKCVKFCRTMA